MFINDKYYSKIASNIELVRNVCVLGHIDHGKTTLADNLLSHNKVISSESVGNAMFMDYRQDERERQITMKSSCFSCIHIDACQRKAYLLNFVDSPGHIDFVHEITAAINLADSGLIVIDVMEGICSQTREVFKQAVEMNLKMILVVNKIDRLFDHGKETDEMLILYKIQNCIEDSNAFISSISKHDKYFDPLKHNVLFASFKDKWAFSLKSVTKFFASKVLHLDLEKQPLDGLVEYFWGKYLFKKSKNEFIKAKSDQNVFSTVVIKSLLNRYKRIYENDTEYISKIEKKLGIKFSFDEIHDCYKNLNFILSESMKDDFPSASLVFDTVVADTPYPIVYDFDRHLSGRILRLYPIKNSDVNLLIKQFLTDSKFDNLRSNMYCILSHVKVMGNEISIGQDLYLEETGEKLTVLSILIQMGKDLIEVSKAFDGTIVTVLFAQQALLRAGQILHSTHEFIVPKENFMSSNGPASSSMLFSDSNIPLLSVNVIPKDPMNFVKLSESLRCLAQCESSIKFSTDNDTGNLVLSTNGEIHLEKAIYDAKQIFSSNIGFETSKVIVPFKEIIKYDVFEQNILKRVIFESKIGDKMFKMESYAFSMYPEVAGLVECEQIYKEVLSKLESIDHQNFKLFSSKNQINLSNYLYLNQNFNPYAIAFLKDSFSNVAKKGPLCQEPLFGLGVIVDRIEFDPSLSYSELAPNFNEAFSHLLKEYFKIHDYRIYWPIYKCTLPCSIGQIREFTHIIKQRWGEIIAKNYDESINQGKYITLDAEIPVFKSIGINKEIQESTSGNIVPRLEFSHWEILDNDAFWQPKTEEEIEDFGENTTSYYNYSRKIVDQVREMKGIKVEKVLVKDANKQRTLTKAK